MAEQRKLPDWWPKKIVSGGQTGVDRAALDWAIANGVPHGGWCPKWRRAEDGLIPAHYNLAETKAKAYRVRTKWNVRDSDATLVVNSIALDGGTLMTAQFAQELGKPYLIAKLDIAGEDVRNAIAQWLRDQDAEVLNVAGPRESKRPGIYDSTIALLDGLADTK